MSPNPRTFRWLLFALAGFGLVADQGSKYGVFRWLYNGGMGGAVQVIPGALELLAQFDPTRPAGTNVLTTWSGEIPPRVNYGALFGLGGEHTGIANGVFAGISLLAAAAICLWGTRQAAARDSWLSASLGLILGGTVGNLYDRVVFGGVRDFLHWYLFEWPVFNVADCCLVVGAVSLVVQALFFTPAEGEKPA